MERHVDPAARAVAAAPQNTVGPWVDIGSGAGNVLHHAKTLGLLAVGIDSARQQLDEATRRGIGLQVLGDAGSLPFLDQSLGHVTSNFGLIFAPDTTIALQEVRRCLLPGGRFIYSAWAPHGWPASLRIILSDHLGIPAKPFPSDLGTVENATAMLGAAGLQFLDGCQDTLRWHFTDVSHAVETLTHAAGGLRLLRSKLEERGEWESAKAKLITDLESRCRPALDGLVLDDDYILVTACCPLLTSRELM